MKDTLFGSIPTYFSVDYMATRVSGHSASKTAEVAVFLPTCRVAGSVRRALRSSLRGVDVPLARPKARRGVWAFSISRRVAV